jgi:hypothetical protein
VTQQVFVSAWRSRDSFDRRRGSLGGWLVRITRNKVADALRDRQREGRVLQVAGGAAVTAPEAPSDRVVDRIVLADELAQLPESQTDPEILALQALGETAGTAEDAEHAETCPRCRSELARLAGIVELARGEGAAERLERPPRQAWDRIAAAVGVGQSPAVADGNGPPVPAARRPRPGEPARRNGLTRCG